MVRPGLKRPTYQGQDPSAEQFARQVNDAFRFLDTLPTTDGVDFQNQDFGTDSGVFPLKHTLGRNARGITVLSCKCKDQKTPTCPAGIPTHVNSKDDNNIAYICLTADMASNFIWSFWVY